MAKTVVGVFQDLSVAKTVVSALGAAGIRPEHVRLVESEREIEELAPPAPAAAPEASGLKARLTEKLTGKIFGLLESLFDDESDRPHASTYAEAVRLGHVLVIADVESADVDQVVAVMNRYGTVDLTQEHWKSKSVGTEAGQPTRTVAAATQATENVVEEELAVGKRVVQRGGVRVHAYVEERPVEEVVRLREERLSVDRRPADRLVSEPDAAFKERSVEVTAEGEEAVVEKRARVVEEVVVGKELEQRDQTVHDTLRRKDVEVEAVPATKTAKPGALGGTTTVERR